MRSRAFRTAKRLGRALLRLPREAAAALARPAADGSATTGEAGPSQLCLAMVVVLPIAAGAGFLIPRLTLVMSPSIDAMLLREAPREIRRGNLVTFMLSHPLAGPVPVRVTKYALCLPGERID